MRLVAAVACLAVWVVACSDDTTNQPTDAWDPGSVDGDVSGDDVEPDPDGDETGGEPLVPSARRADLAASAAVSAEDVRWVAFYDRSHREVRVAHSSDGEEWSEETVAEATLESTRALDLAVADDRPRIAFGHPSRVVYAEREGSGWSTEQISGPKRTAIHRVELELDEKGRPRVFYTATRAAVLHERDDDTWSETELAETLDLGGEPFRFGLGPSDTPHLLYESGPDGADLVLARRQKGTWSTTPIVEETNRNVLMGGLGFSEEGGVRVGYVLTDDESSPEFVVARRSDGAWSRRRHSPNIGVDTVHEFDRSSPEELGMLVSQTENGPYDRSELYWVQTANSDWTVESVLEKRHPVPAAAAAGGTSGEHHIIYIDGRFRNVNWASKDGGSWSAKPVKHRSRRVKELVGLAYGPEGRPHVAYLDGSPLEIRYARRSGETWERSVVDFDRPLAGAHVSGPVVDGDGRAALAHLPPGSGTLRVATGGPQGWSSPAFNFGPGVVNRSAELHVDREGELHLTFLRETAGQVQVWHANGSEGDWPAEKVERAPGEPMYHARLVPDSDSELHAFGRTNRDAGSEIWYWSSRDAGAGLQAVDSEAPSAGFPRLISLEAPGRPHLVYRFGANSIVHARRDGDDWRRESLPERRDGLKPAGYVGRGGDLYVFYRKDGEAKLATSRWKGTRWSTEFESHSSLDIRSGSLEFAVGPGAERGVAVSDEREGLEVVQLGE